MQPQYHPQNIRKIVLKQLLMLLKQQYDQKSYNVNAAIRIATQMIVVDDLPQQISGKSLSQAIYQQLLIIVFSIGQSPSFWIKLLENDQIQSQTNQISIGTPLVLTKIYRIIADQIQREFDSFATQTNFDRINFQTEYMDSKNSRFFAQLLASIAAQICQSYEASSNFIKDQINQIKKINIMNSYLLFAILKQETTIIEKKIEEQFAAGMFRNVPNTSSQFFSKYVLKNYERVVLLAQIENQAETCILNHEQQEEINQKNTQEWLKYINKNQKKFVMKRLMSEEGQQAMLVMKKQQKKEEQIQSGLIIEVSKTDPIKVINTKATQKSWYAFQIDQTVQKLNEMVKFAETQQIDKEMVGSVIPLDAYAIVGGNIGKCLAGINSYANANQFFTDVTKKTVISGSTLYLIMEIPILNFFLIAGGFSYSFYKAFSNEATNNPSKFKKFGKSTATVIGTAGSTVAGMLLGQMLIPVPVFGAIVGGVIGGFLGEKGSKQITSAIQRNEFKEIIDYLKENIQRNCYWHFSQEILNVLGISFEYFQKHNPFKGSSRKIWLTAICFCVVSFYESKKYAAFTKKKLKEIEQKKIQSPRKGTQKLYKNIFDIVAITDYLTAHFLYLNSKMSHLQATVCHLIAE